MRSQKAITPILAIIMMVIIVVGLAGGFYIWMTTTFQRTTNQTQRQLEHKIGQIQTTFHIEGVHGNEIYIRNDGSQSLDTTKLGVYVDGKRVLFDDVGKIGGGKVKNITFYDALTDKHSIKVTSLAIKDSITHDFKMLFLGWSDQSAFNCAGTKMMGGYGNFGSGASTSKTINNLPAGDYTVEFNYYFGDSWDGEEGRLYWNGNLIWSQSCSGNCYGSDNVCGRGWSDGVESPVFSATVTHSGGSATLEFTSTLNQGANDEWWGVSNILLRE